MANMTSGGSKDRVTNDDTVKPTILSLLRSNAATTDTGPAAELPSCLYTSPEIGMASRYQGQRSATPDCPRQRHTNAVSAYVLLKYVHVLLAIIAIGFNASYGIWLSRVRKEPEHALHVLRGIKTLDDRFANPAYILLLITGVALALIGNLPMLSTFWIAAGLALYVVLLVVAVAFYSPTLKRQIAVLQSAGPTSAEYQRL